MSDRGRTITHLQVPRFHTQAWYNDFDTCQGWTATPVSEACDWVAGVETWQPMEDRCIV